MDTPVLSPRVQTVRHRRDAGLDARSHTLADAYDPLGQTHEAGGRTDEAVYHYEPFVRAWADGRRPATFLTSPDHCGPPPASSHLAVSTPSPFPSPAPPDGWLPWPPDDGVEHTVTGDVRVLRDVAGPRPEDRRDVWIWLPPSCGAEARRYPVFYLQDGQNLFDHATSFAGEWGVDEAMEGLAEAGVEALVVGVSNLDDRRLHEYSAWPDPKHGGGGADEYLDFVVGTVKARVDRDFPTLTGPRHTGVGGSSMGGLLALHAFLARPGVFGMAAVMSPALWYARKAALGEAARRAAGRGRIHLDVGTGEGWRAVRNVRKLRKILLRNDYVEGGNLRWVEARKAPHHEGAWGRRFGPAVRFLLEGRRHP